MTSFPDRRAKILGLAELPLQRAILDRMDRLVWHKGNANHYGDHVQDFDFPTAIGMTLTEGIVLYGLVRMSPDYFNTFWEVGSYVGWSTAFMAEAIRKRRPSRGIVHAFDHFESKTADGVAELTQRFTVNTRQWRPFVRLHVGTTPEAFRTPDGMGERPPLPDFVLLDGGHHGGQPWADVDGILTLGRYERSPTFVFHDAWIPDVYDAVESLTADGFQTFEFDTSNQLTVVTKDERVLDMARMVYDAHAPFHDSIAKGG